MGAKRTIKEIRERWGGQVAVGCKILQSRIETSYTPNLYYLFLTLFLVTFALWFSSFSEYKIIRLRLGGRGQTSAGVHGSNFMLAAKLLQHSLFFVQENRSTERHQLRRAYRSARGWALLIRCFCHTSLCTVFLQFCQPGNYMSLMVYVQLVLLGINNKKANWHLYCKGLELILGKNNLSKQEHYVDGRLSATPNFSLFWLGISTGIFSFALSLVALMPSHVASSLLLLDAAKMNLHPCWCCDTGLDRWRVILLNRFTKPSFTLAFHFLFRLCYEKMGLTETSENSAGFSRTLYLHWLQSRYSWFTGVEQG